MSQTFAFDVDASNFQQVVIEGSKQAPVVVDFWAPWCGPCKMLKPILEKLAEEYQGKFVLAKVNSDQNQELAAQFGVRGIPSVKAVVGGQVVEEFSGAIPESSVREFLDRIIPSPAGQLRLQALQQRAAGDAAGALQTLAQASKLDVKNEQIRIDAAEILLDQNQLEDAQRLLDSLSPATKLDERPRQLLAKLGFALGSRGDEHDLRARIAAQPDDMDARMNLANVLVAAGRYQEGLDALLEMVRMNRSWNDDAARKAILDIFSMLDGEGDLISVYRRKLASALN
jgi:putative thioredoxin